MEVQEKLKISLIQASPFWEDVEANIQYFQAIFDQNENELRLSDIVILPEMFSTSFTMNTSLAAESYNKGLNDLLLKYAQKFQIAICGSLMAIEPETHSVVNKFLFVQASGEVISYNKKHLFTLANEGKHYSAGTQKVLIHYKGWKILPLICYDIRFPVWCRRTPLHDYDLAIVVASWPEKRSFAWRNLLPARAIENQAFYAAVNRVGEDANAILHSGDSVVLDFRGKALNAAKPFEEKVLTTELNIQDLKIHRKAFRFFDDRDEFQIL